MFKANTKATPPRNPAIIKTIAFNFCLVYFKETFLPFSNQIHRHNISKRDKKLKPLFLSQDSSKHKTPIKIPNLIVLYSFPFINFKYKASKQFYL